MCCCFFVYYVEPNEGTQRAGGIVKCDVVGNIPMVLVHSPFTYLLRKLMFIPLSPKAVYTPSEVGWKPWKPRGMNKGYALPPLETCYASVACPTPKVVIRQLLELFFCSVAGVFRLALSRLAL